ncbi:MAG: Amino deacylase [uncultured Acetobacteraceae bacterium]|uniref:Amino deacylase n=1 Tax=uncultured Acetobacteraceae bacterium TaxID=169975 RepID=A0A6J4JIA4_9PROT|nr:MAG: Amino deacylase [uncultured Acetobacteraceae bacterium]
MRAFHHPDHVRHDPRFFLQRGEVRRNFEVPARVGSLLAGLDGLGLAPGTAPLPDAAALAAVHTRDYLDFLASAAGDWAALPGAGPEAVANIHPAPEMLAQGARPGDGVIGRVGWFTADTACPIGPGTWEACLAAAGTALAAAAEAAKGGSAYALCRPPGHHAYAARAGGHCYVNNAALAARALRRAGASRVAVIDIDSHHGNGTQGIFWEDAEVLTVSVHADPTRYYPWYVGHADERGAGAGEGRNVNLPLPLGSGDGAWLGAVRHGIEAARGFGAEALVVPLGFDASKDEPLAALKVTPDGFARAGAALAGLRLPTAITQEGGYNVDLLGALLARFLTGWSEAA